MYILIVIFLTLIVFGLALARVADKEIPKKGE